MTEKEFGNISERIRGRLLGLADRFVRSAELPDSPEDIVQESMLRLWNLLQRGYPVKDVQALAVKIAKNLCVDRLRKRRLKRQPITGDDYSGGISASKAVEEKDNRRIKNFLYDSLTETQKRYIIMRNELGMTLEEISKETGKPKDSIKVTISMARRRMLAKLKEQL